MAPLLVDVHTAAVSPVPAVDKSRSQPVHAPIGYVTNVYPHVSHSFIRREIQALEQRGIDVLRFSIRPAGTALPDPDDQAERARTVTLLDAGVAALIGAAAVTACTRPIRFVRALGTARAMARANASGVVRNTAYLLEACLLARIARRRGIRHLHAHFGTNPAAVARLAGIVGDLSYSMTVHGPDEFDGPVALSLPGKIADAAFVVAVSHYGSGQLKRWSEWKDWSKIHVVRCGLDRTFLSGGELMRDTAATVAPTFLCVARLSPQKGLSLLIDAAAQLAPEIDFTIHIVGDGEMRDELAARIKERGLGTRVSLLGWRSASDIRNALRTAHALVLPSFAEGLPVVLMEALALECPVIATAIAGIPELVDQECGWVIPAGSTHALMEALRTALITDQNTLRAMGAAGRDRVLKWHDAAANAADLADLLAEAR